MEISGENPAKCIPEAYICSGTTGFGNVKMKENRNGIPVYLWKKMSKEEREEKGKLRLPTYEPSEVDKISEKSTDSPISKEVRFGKTEIRLIG